MYKFCKTSKIKYPHHKDNDYDKDALVNYVMMLGWNPEYLETKIVQEGFKDKHEIMTLEEAIKLVSGIYSLNIYGILCKKIK